MNQRLPDYDWLKPPLLPIGKGKRLRLSLPRRQVGDMLHFAMKVPSVPVQRCMRLGPLFAARQNMEPRPKWVLLLAKGFSLVAAEMSRLRQAYMSFPWPHLYEHPHSIATIAVEREYKGEEAVFFPKFHAPDEQPIATLEGYLRYFKDSPIEEVSEYWLGLFVSRWWRPIRRSLWWYALNVSGDIRARVYGTFGVSVYGGLGAQSLHPISPVTSLLNFGTIDSNGHVDLRLVYDHRVLDGAVVARVLNRLEEVLNDQVADDLGAEPPHLIPFPRRGAA